MIVLPNGLEIGENTYENTLKNTLSGKFDQVRNMFTCKSSIWEMMAASWPEIFLSAAFSSLESAGSSTACFCTYLTRKENITISLWLCKKGDYWFFWILNSHVHDIRKNLFPSSYIEIYTTYSPIEWDICVTQARL